MRLAAAIAGLAVLAALSAPEVARYKAERRVGWATAAFRELLASPRGPETNARMLAVGQVALSAAGALKGDARPWMVVASSFLVTGQPERALEFYREAFATGERSEIDLNLGRAYGALSRADSARAAFLRAGWISPEILASLPEAQRAPLLAEIARLADALRQGGLASPPPLPEEERR